MNGDIIFGLPLIFLLCLIIGLIKPKWVVRWGAVEKRNRKKVFVYYGIILIISIIVSNFLFNTYGMDYTSSEKYNASSYNTGITYEQLARTPENYKNKKVRLTGTVFQVLESNGRTQLRVAVSNNMNNVIIVEYKANVLKQRFLENDTVTVSGRFIDIWSSTSLKGEKMNDPAIWADNIELNNLNTSNSVSNTSSNELSSSLDYQKLAKDCYVEYVKKSLGDNKNLLKEIKDIKTVKGDNENLIDVSGTLVGDNYYRNFVYMGFKKTKDGVEPDTDSPLYESFTDDINYFIEGKGKTGDNSDNNNSTTVKQ